MGEGENNCGCNDNARTDALRALDASVAVVPYGQVAATVPARAARSDLLNNLTPEALNLTSAEIDSLLAESGLSAPNATPETPYRLDHPATPSLTTPPPNFQRDMPEPHMPPAISPHSMPAPLAAILTPRPAQHFRLASHPGTGLKPETSTPSPLPATWFGASSLSGGLLQSGIQLQSIGGTGIVKDYEYAGANDCVYRIRIKKPVVNPDISQEDLDYIAATLASFATVESGDPPSADTLWKYFDRPIWIGRGDDVVAVLKLDGMMFLTNPCIIWIQLSLVWWRGEGTGEAHGVSGRGVAPGDPVAAEPGSPAGVTSEEECEEWARRYIAWLKAQGREAGHSAELYCAGRRYEFVVQRDGEVHGIHYPPIPGVGNKIGPPRPSGPAPITCPGSVPQVTAIAGRTSPLRKRKSQIHGQPPVWDETWEEYVERVFGDEGVQKKWKDVRDEFRKACRGSGGSVFFEVYDYTGKPLQPPGTPQHDGNNFRLICLTCNGTCWPGTNCVPISPTECNCV